jgi:hypothetical protein
VGPRLEPLHHPGQLPNRRVGGGVGQGLGPGGLELEVAVAGPGRAGLQARLQRLLGVGEAGQLLRVDGSEGDEPEGGHVDVHPDHVAGVEAAQLGGDERPQSPPWAP